MKPATTCSLLVALGLAVGGTVGILAFAMAGGGHGWTSAGISAISVVTAPIAGLAWFLRKRRAGQILIGLLVVAAVAMNIVLLLETEKEGWEYAYRVWSAEPVFVTLWGVLVLSWQFAVAFMLLLRVRHRAS